MERLNNRLNSSGQTFETSKELRISNRPLAHNQNAFGCYSSTLAPSKKKGENGIGDGTKPSQTRPKFKPAFTEQQPSTKPPTTTTRQAGSKQKPRSSDESSEDEMDLLSESSQHGHYDNPGSSRNPVPSSSKTATQKSVHATSSKTSKSEDVYIDSTGKSHQYHPDYKPAPKKYASLSFRAKKNGSESATLADQKSDLSSSSRKPETASNENAFMSANGPSSWSPVVPRRASSYDDDVVDITSSPLKGRDDNDVARTSPLSGKSANSNRARTPTPSNPRQGRDPGPSLAKDSLGKPTKERPKPVPIRRGAPQAKVGGESRGIADLLRALPSRLAPGSTSPEPAPACKKKSDASKRSSKTSNNELKPAPFPLGSMDVVTTPKATEKSQKKQPVRAKPFPMVEDSSQVFTRTAKEKAQPKAKGKSRKIIQSEEEEDEEAVGQEKPGQALKPKAFPMSSTDWSLGSPSPRPSKRNSDYGSEDERAAKKSRKGKDHSPVDAPFLDEGDSMSLAPHADPKTLCPFCDTSLPRYPSPLLVRLLEDTKKQASKDPRPSNPLGLRAPLTTYITVCRRHLFESKILPEAERKGWPKTIKWKKVSGRVLKLKDFLQALIEDTGDTTKEQHLGVSEWEMEYGAGSNSGKGKGKAKGPKASSIFWMETLEEIEKKGLRAVSGVRGQFANFEKAQPGYYGEMGSVIIYQTLYNMFPPTEIDPVLISPLTPTEFIQRILVPEVALHLIMEDQNLENDEDGMKEALEILRDSSSYGVAMFPEDRGEWGQNKGRDVEKMGEADLIVMERARKRRKELKAEEEREEEEQKLRDEQARKLKEEEEARAEAEKAKNRKSQRGRTERPPSVPHEPQVLAERPRPRPVPIKKSKASMSSSSAPASEDEKQDSNARWARSRSRSIVSDDSDMEKEYRYRPSSEERRRSPSASESCPQENSGNGMLSRAPSHVMARLSIALDDPPSDSSTRALVNGEGRTSSQDTKNAMNIASDDSEVEFVGDVKTPIPNRARRSSVVDDDDADTPKPSHSLKPSVSKAQLPPLLRARMRNEALKPSASKPGPSKNSQGYQAPSQKSGFDWLHSSP